MPLLNSFKNDFIYRLQNKPEESIFFSDQHSINSYQALDYYYKSIKNLDENQLIAFICNSSLESIILSFFLILSETKTIFLSSDQNFEDIRKVISDNNIRIVLGFQGTPHKLQLSNLDGVDWVDVKTLDNYLFDSDIDQLFFHRLKKYELENISSSIFMSSGSTSHPKIIPLEYSNINFTYNSIKSQVFKNLDYERIICIHDTSFVIVINFLQAFCSNKNSRIYGCDFNNAHLSILTLVQTFKDEAKDLIITVPSVYSSIITIFDSCFIK